MKDGDPMTHPGRPGHDTFIKAWLGIIRRRWAWGLGVFATVLGLTALLLFTTHPVYRAQASLRLGEPPPPGGVSPTSNLLGVFGLGGGCLRQRHGALGQPHLG